MFYLIISCSRRVSRERTLREEMFEMKGKASGQTGLSFSVQYRCQIRQAIRSV